MNKKLKILGVMFLIVALNCFAISIAHAYDPTKIEAMSAPKFWAAVMGANQEKDPDKEYIICGPNVCDPEKEQCMVLEEERPDLISFVAKLNRLGAGLVGVLLDRLIYVVRGDGKVISYDYKCVAPSSKEMTKLTQKGWTVAEEGGFVQKKKVVSGGKWVKSSVEEESCYKGNDGKEYCLLTKEKGGEMSRATVSYNKDNTAFRGCEVIPVKLYDNRKCFFCPLFTVIYAVANHITSISFSAFANAFAQLIALGLAIWIAFQTLVHVSSITKQDIGKFLVNLIKQSYKFVIAFLLLISSVEIYEYAIIPIARSGIKFGSTMLESKYSVVKTEHGITDWVAMEDVNPGITKRAQKISISEDDLQYYDGNLYVDLDNFIAQLQRTISFMQVVGTSLICIGGHAMTFRGDILGFGDGFQAIIQGVLLAGFAFLISISIAFYLLDAIVQLGLVGAIMPFLIACWPFKLTSKYTGIGWNMFLNSVFLLMFSGVVISVNLNLVEAALNYGTDAQDCVDGDCKGDEVQMGSLYRIAQAINTQDEKKLQDLTDISSLGFLILVFCCIFGFKFTKKGSELAGKFASGALSPIAPEIATMAGSAAKSLALKSTQSTREGIDDVVKRTGSALFHPIRTVKGLINRNKSSGNSGGDSNSNSQTSQSTSSSGSKSTSQGDQNNQANCKPNSQENKNNQSDDKDSKVDKAKRSGKRNKKGKAKNTSRKQRRRTQNRSRARNRTKK